MKSAQILRRKINSSQVTVGVIATDFFWVGLVEICQRAGLDYLIIDQEHVAHDEAKVSDACTLARLIDFPVLIRPPETQYSFVRRALDKGACGMLLPMVRNTATLDEVRDAIYLAPRGRRRPGGPGNRWVTNYNQSTWVEQVENDVIILPQIEDLTGLSNVQEIARHEVVTAMAIGPYDLSAHLGVCWEPNNPKLIAAQEQIRAAGKAAGKNMWMIGDGPTLVKRGFNFLCISEPSAGLEVFLKTNANALRTQAAEGATTTATTPATPVVRMDKVD